MAIKLFLQIFFAIPIWLLRCLTLKKRIFINNQILDFQTSVFLGLQSLQMDSFDDPNNFNSVEEIRDLFSEDLPLNLKPSMPIKIIDHKLNTEYGDLVIREYCPKKILTKSPILYFHGGGYVMCSIETHDPWLQFFSAEIAGRIFSVDYRLAPENKFPSALNDANLALDWLSEKYSIPIKEISICGDSAGGHLATSLSTYRATNHLELPLSQCLIYPMIDPTCNSKSQRDFAEGYFLTKKTMVWFWKHFMESEENLNDPLFNLTIGPNVELPKTLIITAGFDPLSDEGEEYARQLHDSGNKVQQVHYPHLIHGFVNMTSLKAAKDATKDLINTYKNYLN
tara:strand:- start:1957 stop:2973 length:1017 start_codon:yes stop_codon:yes gene_type:complete